MSMLENERGAAMVFGVFFAIFLLACVYVVYGTVETVLYRQHVQDAADAAAFSAAVVNARGMNLIVLINMTMAIVFSILVALRLAETLGYVAIGVCLALSAVTFGATASAVPPLQTMTKGIATAAEKVKKPIEAILKVMHALGGAVRVVVPVGANVRVIDLVASHYDAAGASIPARLTLPVEDDEFKVLCSHAAKIAADLAILPISPILPKQVEDKLGDVVAKIATAGADWFCPPGTGTPPDLNSDEKYQWIELPRFASQEACDQKAKSRVDTDEADEATREACNAANLEQLASVPDRLGRCREGEKVCPTDCSGSGVRESCPPVEFGSCTSERASELSSYAASKGMTANVTCTAGNAYHKRLELARTQCLPQKQGGRADLGGFTWLQRQVTREYRWNIASKSWREDVSERIEEPVEIKRVKDKAQTPPCGVDGSVGTDYHVGRDEPLCQSVPRCQTSAYRTGLLDGPCIRTPPPPSAPQFFSESSVEVVELLRCVYRTKNPQITTPKMDLQKELAGGSKGTNASGQGKKKAASMDPFRLEQDIMLGQSDFQLRSVVVDGAPPSLGQKVVALAWAGGPRGDDVEEEGGAIARAMTRVGRLGFAQAEYYFDWTTLGKGAPNSQTKAADISEWMWTMGWRARLRPFRVRYSDADPEPPKGSQGAAQGQGKKTLTPKLSCGSKAAELCEGSGADLKLLGVEL